MMKELQPNLLDDYEHRVKALMSHHGGEPGFPRMEEFGITAKSLDDYLFDYQVVLDSEGSQRSQLTLYGILAVVPTLVLSAFPEEMLPWGHWSLLAGLAMGIGLALVVKGIRVGIKQARLRSLRAGNPDEEAYIRKVLTFDE